VLRSRPIGDHACWKVGCNVSVRDGLPLSLSLSLLSAGNKRRLTAAADFSVSANNRVPAGRGSLEQRCYARCIALLHARIA